MITGFRLLPGEGQDKGGQPLQSDQMEDFHTALLDSGLGNLGFSVIPFTWEKFVRSGVFLQERLNLAVASGSWQTLFPRVWVRNFHFPCFNHNVVEVHLTKATFHQRPVCRFEKLWVGEEKCKSLIKESWGKKSGLSEQLGESRKNMSRYNPDEFCKLHHRIKFLESKLEQVSYSVSTPVSLHRRMELLCKLQDLLGKEDQYWSQRSHQLWLRDGEKYKKKITSQL